MSEDFEKIRKLCTPIIKLGGKCDDCGKWHNGEHEQEGKLLFGMTFCQECTDKRLGLYRQF